MKGLFVAAALKIGARAMRNLFASHAGTPVGPTSAAASRKPRVRDRGLRK